MKEFCKSIVVRILVAEAKILIRRHKPCIIAITGSVGKTSTKDSIYSVLKKHVHARKSQKSFNSEIGVPLSILGLSNAWSNPISWLKNIVEGLFVALFSKEYPDVLVLETGIDRPGDMKKLTQWLHPDVVVLTRLPDVPVHVEYFPTAEDVVEEKMALVHALKEGGILVYNHDDQKVCEVVQDVRQQSVGYGRYAPTHFTASGERVLLDGSVPAGMEFTLTHMNDQVRIPIRQSLGVQHAYNYAAAAAVGHIFEVPLDAVAEALGQHMPPAGRMKLVAGHAQTTIIDDTYNSSPVAAQRAVQTLKELPYAKRKIAVLGDMLELGQFSVREHERLGAQVAESADILITLGVRARKIAEAALEHGLSEKVIFQYDDVLRAGRELRDMLDSGDVVLVKASQGVRAEKVVEIIMAQPERAEELLVRQDQVWRAKS